MSACEMEQAEEATCTYNGERYKLGVSFSDKDGCNECFCNADGDISCTTAICGPLCEYGGEIYEAGTSFPDGCNECSCDLEGNVSCTDAVCASSAVCEYGGDIYNVGSSFPAGDGCNECSCDAENIVSCTELDCEPL